MGGPIPSGLDPLGARSVAACQLRVVPARDAARGDLQGDALARLPADSLLDARPLRERARHLLVDAQDGAVHQLLVVDDLGIAADQDALQGVVGLAGFDVQRDLRVASDVHRLLRLAVGAHPQRAVVVDREPHRHRVRIAAWPMRTECQRPRLGDVVLLFGGGQGDGVALLHGWAPRLAGWPDPIEASARCKGRSACYIF